MQQFIDEVINAFSFLSTWWKIIFIASIVVVAILLLDRVVMCFIHFKDLFKKGD